MGFLENRVQTFGEGSSSEYRLFRSWYRRLGGVGGCLGGGRFSASLSKTLSCAADVGDVELCGVEIGFAWPEETCLNCRTVDVPLPNDISKPKGCLGDGCALLSFCAVGVLPEVLRLVLRAVGVETEALRAVMAETFL